MASLLLKKLQQAKESRELDLSAHHLGTLPAEIGQLTNLRKLNLDGNGLNRLPSEICQLTNLQQLELGNNLLTSLPPEIGELTSLRMLNLGSNRLTSLPPEICNLTRLRALGLSVNQLGEVPTDIDRLSDLRVFNLFSNNLRNIPAQIFQLANLSTLRLGMNRLTEVQPEIGQLVNLQELGLDRNKLVTLPPEIGRLTKLEVLVLSANLLETLPAEISRLISLQKLELERNQLATLPGEFADLLSNGLLINLERNPLKEPLAELVKRGTDPLVTYLRSLSDSIVQYEGKLLLVGEGNVGKTSLIDALRGYPFIENRPTTHGIEIKSLKMPHPTLDENMVIRVWDFGGQEVYRISHQFFFTRRAIYLVVWNAREGQEQNDVEGWIRRIRLRVRKDARILVVATHCDERFPELDYPYLERTFPEILAGGYSVDNSTDHGISNLRKGIAQEALHLPQMGQQISLRWLEARDEILTCSKTQPQISYRQFTEICQRHKVYADEIITLAELMHDLGHIIYYGEDEGLRDVVILDPEWLTEAISYVLEDEPTRQSNGILDHARLVEIWRDRSEVIYPKDYYPYFLRLMEKFDVSYRLEDDEYRSLVAQLVPHRRPELPWEVNAPIRPGFRRLALICKLSEPANGLVAWLTVRHHRASIGKHWRTGVFLRHPIAAYASEALLELRGDDQLLLDVRAPSPDLFFNVLRDSIEDLITRRWPGIDYQLLVPCPTRLPKGLNCPGRFPLKFLLEYRERDAVRTPCHECLHEHDLSQLLTGFAQPDISLQYELTMLNNQLAEIGVGVNRLEDGMKELEGYAAETANSIRKVLRSVSSEINDCPCLFTLTTKDTRGLQRVKLYQRNYKLVLWCEHPGYWHPWDRASYSIAHPKEWMIKIMPYARLVVRTLSLVVPAVAATANLGYTGNELERIKDEVDVMTRLLAELPEGSEDYDEFIAEFGNKLTPAEGSAARALRIMLFEHDRSRAFGDLRRVQAPSGDFLWVCTNHYPEYDPGLPSMPLQDL
jgi:Leucine-rich repeat (LRR) protein